MFGWGRKKPPDLFQGWPKTKKTKDGIEIKAEYTSPDKLKWRDIWYGLANLVLVGFGVLMVSQQGQEGLIPAVIFVAFFSFLIYQMLTSNTKVTTWIVFTPELIRIRQGYGSWQELMLGLPHGFDIMPHRKAEEEAEEDNIKYQQSGGKERAKKYYRDSFHVVMNHTSALVNIADIHGDEWAAKLVNRLQGVDKVMQAASHMQPGAPDRDPYEERPNLDE